MSEREAFKAGMIAMMYEAHLELTGMPYTGNTVWTAKDEAMLNRMYDLYLSANKRLGI